MTEVGDRYVVRDDDPYADARPMNDTDRFNRSPFDDRMRQTPSPSGQLHLDEFFFLHQLFSPLFFTSIISFHYILPVLCIFKLGRLHLRAQHRMFVSCVCMVLSRCVDTLVTLRCLLGSFHTERLRRLSPVS